jgi:hypothetical protein
MQCIRESIVRIKVFTNLHVPSPPECEKWFTTCDHSVCIIVYTYGILDFIHIIHMFEILPILGRCFANVVIPAPIIRPLVWPPKHKIASF